MSKFVEIEGYDGPIYVEVNENLGSDQSLAQKRGPETEPALSSLPKFMDTVVSNSQAIMERMKALSPDEVTITLGITASGEVGSSILGFAKVSGESNIEITLTWKKSSGAS